MDQETNLRKEQIKKDMETMSHIMANCFSDEGCRLHQRRYDELVKELVEIERNERSVR